tara:strand:+ start:15978 stop:16874 length:897 start_codon:yes stop_codon:yes gene_type:complete
MDLKIKLFGERNTATRAVKRMLRETDGVTLFNTKRPDDMGNVEWANMMASINLYIQDDWRKVYVDALRDNVAHHNAPLAMWKHAAPVWDDTFKDQDVSTIFCVRNPYSWALSMACKPYHMKARRTDDFLTFIKRPWLTERRDNTGILLRSVMGLWNTKLRAYADFADQAELSDGQYAYLRFEDFVADPTLALSTALKTFGTNALPEPIDKSTKNHGKPLSELQDYYAMECWRSRLTASTVQAINDLLDWPLVDQFCYERLNARDFPESLPANVQEAFSYEMLNLNRKPELELEKSASN